MVYQSFGATALKILWCPEFDKPSLAPDFKTPLFATEKVGVRTAFDRESACLNTAGASDRLLIFGKVSRNLTYQKWDDVSTAVNSSDRGQTHGPCKPRHLPVLRRASHGQ